jgi:uncharacterized membrane protein YedE/YeeE
MTLETGLNEVGPVIQLAIAPVFLLTAIGALLGVHTSRLARVVDRSRTLEERHAERTGCDGTPIVEELDLLRRRGRLTYRAMMLDVVSALFVGLTIVSAFVDAFLDVNLSRLIALLFTVAMVAFIASLLVFLREIFLAVRQTCARNAHPR